ncbi:MAG: transglycosylase SLT domain-containing protein [Gammaproteobacteria bacterium]|nr:transglycosylase SLT domain-containing protein [Gammaproteobacteria bacterium]
MDQPEDSVENSGSPDVSGVPTPDVSGSPETIGARRADQPPAAESGAGRSNLPENSPAAIQDPVAVDVSKTPDVPKNLEKTTAPRQADQPIGGGDGAAGDALAAGSQSADGRKLDELLSCAHVCDERLEPVINFWLRVFTQIHSRQVYVHDARFPERIFATVDVPKRSKRFVRQTIKRWRSKLNTLASTKPEKYTAAQTRLAQNFAGVNPTRRAQEIRASAKRLRLQAGQANFFRAGLVRSGRYRRQFTEILHRHGVPEMVVALPMVESAYNNIALSHVGAAGMWQFMRETARRYVTVNSMVDERLDPHLAADAAARLLSNNYELTGSWALAVTGYNHGVSGMLRARKQLGTDDIYTIISQYKGRRFGFASRNFFVELLAAWAIYSNPQKYFPGIVKDKEQVVERLSLSRGYLSASNLAAVLNTSLTALRQANPHYTRAVWSDEVYFPVNALVALPPGMDPGVAALALQRSAQNLWASRQKQRRFHTIRRGETLSTIAAYYGIRQSKLAAVNNIRGHRIYAGRKLILPHAAAQLSPKELERLHAQLNPSRKPKPARKPRRRKAVVGHSGSSAGSATSNNGTGRINGEVSIAGDSNIAGADDAAAAGKNTPETAAEKDAISVWLSQVENNEISSEEFMRRLMSRNIESSDADVPSATANGDISENTLVDDEQRLLADPSDYGVDEQGYLISVNDETLGHYADWLGVATQSLRRLNDLRFGRALRVGQRLRLDFSIVNAQTFYHRRISWHLQQQDDFFSQFQIADIIHYRVQRGDSIWKIVHRQDISPPLWLVQQLNPELNMATISYSQTIRLPVLQPAAE